MAVIAEGDHVILYGSRDSIHSAHIDPAKVYASRFGQYKHSDMIGKKFGSKIASVNNKGFIYVLRPTPELWTLALPHRTQILYAPDIAFISSYLNVVGGSKVVEAGTGSGSFTHSLARNVGPTGKVHSFEFNEERYLKATEEFRQNKIDDVVTLRHRNVCKDGFGELDSEVDAVFLDLPAPWEAIPHAKKALKKDRAAKICCFSPCIEQVLRTVTALRENGFADVTMYETLQRQYEPAHINLPPISNAIARLNYVEYKKEKRREGQIALAAKRKLEKEQDALHAKASDGSGETSDEPVAKRAKIDDAAELDASWTFDPPPDLPPGEKVPSYKVSTLSRGHTSFLTFATLLPGHASALGTNNNVDVDTQMRDEENVQSNGVA